MDEPEANLVARATCGDAAALSTLLEQHAPHIRHELRLDSQWLAKFDLDDVMQVTFLEAFLHIRRFDPAGSGTFAGWLLQIAQNNLRDLIREQARAKRPAPDGQVHGAGSDDSYVALIDMLSGTTGATPSRQAEKHEVRGLLERAIARLPDVYREVVQRFDLEGRSAEEVGAQLGRSPGAVYMLRGRAHDRLRELLGAESNFFSNGA
ncbi:MAG: sigma-70 family RNA polymerase sigma factor [Planctomycetota bacterium]